VCLLFAQQTVAATAAMPAHLEYNVLRNGEPVGQHIMDFRAAGDSLQAQISITSPSKWLFLRCL
jgi:hypothetical protein